MEERKLHFFGASYHHFTYNAIEREFPVSHCLFVDKTKVDINKVDHRPGWQNFPKNDVDYPDTDYSVYKTFKPLGNYESVRAVKGGSLEYLYNTLDSEINRQYLWKNKAFGIHGLSLSIEEFVGDVRKKDNY